MIGTEELHLEIKGVLFDTNPVPLWIGDSRRLRFLDVNQAALDLYGYTREEFLSLSPLDIRPWEDVENFLKINQDISVFTNLGIHRHIKKDGNIIRVEIYANSIIFNGEKARLIMCHDMTEKIEAEENLLRSETLLSESQRVSKIGSWELTLTDLKDLNNNKTYWSDQSFRLFGLEPRSTEACREVYLSFVHPDDLENVQKILRKTVDNHVDYNSEHRIIRADGVERILKLSGKILHDDNPQKPEKIIGTIEDVTERKESENKIAVLSAAVSQSPISIVITDTSGSIVFANPKFSSISGYEIDEILGNNPRMLKSGHTSDADYNNLWKTISSGQKWEGEFYNKKKNGDYYWESAIITPVFNEHCKIMNYLAIKTDITDKKDKEEKLKISEAKYRAVAETANDAILTAESEGIIDSWNNGAAKIFGYSEEEILGKNVNLLIPQDYLDDLAIWIEKYKDAGKDTLLGSTIEIEGLRKNGKSFPIELSLSSWENNEKTYFTAIMRDISERKLEEELRDKMMNDLIQRNKDLEQFTYIVSHNLRSPVANIKGTADILIYMDISTEENKALLSGMNESINRLDEVIRDLNNILQLKHNITEKNERIKFSDIVKEILESLQPEFQNSEFKIYSDFSAINEISSLKSYIYSIFLNLITNSYKYRRPVEDPKIEIDSKIIDGKIILTFRDNGIGMNLENMGNQIFGLYKRFHFHTEGKGIGLHLVKTQVESLGGTISVQSKENEGTKFIISFKNE